MAEELSDDDWAVWDAFYMMRRRLDRALELGLHGTSGVSAPEYEVLVGLGRSSDRRLRVRDIAEQIGWEKSRVSHMVTRMERRGLVRRTECASDARGTWVELTSAGRRAMLTATRSHTAAIRRYFVDALDGDDAVVKAFSGRVLDAIGADASPDAPAEEARVRQPRTSPDAPAECATA
ncbi:MarR family winged helix-turn-helix transcriptional regulator [Frigoribacterium sp. 2-23]|uniref:MarR family winged helix-turn-helix transcriptional regulator n=1 Tax=Frigoribacterium sp. 2-23 TaxID=3415006 RepID=UPI003C6F29B2